MPSDDAISGPYTVTVSDCPDPIFYRVQLLGTDGRKSSFRRYSDFAALDDAARKAVEDVPAMPPRSFFRKHFLPGFMDRRRRELHFFLVSMLEADPYCDDTPGLREFLGLPALPPVPEAALPVDKSFGLLSATPVAPDRNLYTILESSENEAQEERRVGRGRAASRIPQAEKAAAAHGVAPPVQEERRVGGGRAAPRIPRAEKAAATRGVVPSLMKAATMLW